MAESVVDGSVVFLKKRPEVFGLRHEGGDSSTSGNWLSLPKKILSDGGLLVY